MPAATGVPSKEHLPHDEMVQEWWGPVSFQHLCDAGWPSPQCEDEPEMKPTTSSLPSPLPPQNDRRVNERQSSNMAAVVIVWPEDDERVYGDMTVLYRIELQGIAGSGTYSHAFATPFQYLASV